MVPNSNNISFREPCSKTARAFKSSSSSQAVAIRRKMTQRLSRWADPVWMQTNCWVIIAKILPKNKQIVMKRLRMIFLIDRRMRKMRKMRKIVKMKSQSKDQSICKISWQKLINSKCRMKMVKNKTCTDSILIIHSRLCTLSRITLL